MDYEIRLPQVQIPPPPLTKTLGKLCNISEFHLFICKVRMILSIPAHRVAVKIAQVNHCRKLPVKCQAWKKHLITVSYSWLHLSQCPSLNLVPRWPKGVGPVQTPPVLSLELTDTGKQLLNPHPPTLKLLCMVAVKKKMEKKWKWKWKWPCGFKSGRCCKRKGNGEPIPQEGFPGKAGLANLSYSLGFFGLVLPLATKDAFGLGPLF